ncbi:PepSY-associated TM helix domain-containing protein [Parafilimonas sp.]|uniref:PepSY-associated TM helix domain-containing protein n=1 Tax=Parafilimonas sp. TaxID=1969739 RepID=UPI0039E2F1BE
MALTFKKITGKIHLWLGLASGIIIVFLGITGCILVFEQEIKSVTEPYLHVKESNRPVLPPSRLHQIGVAALPGKIPHSVSYSGKDKSAQVAFYNADPEYYYVVYINPYTGKVLKVKNENADFFRVIVMGHFYLWLPPAIGQPIVATATLIFLIMLISGLVLWWPKNKAARKQRFSIKWNTSFKRKNYDLHNVLGFYMSWVAIFIAVTGLVWGFQWFAKSFYWATSGGKQMTAFYEPVSEKPASPGINTDAPAMDKIWRKMNAAYKNAKVIEVHVPDSDTAAIEAVANPDGGTYWQADYHYFDQYSLKEIPVKHPYGLYANTSVADKIMRMNYDVHTGAVLGIAGKIMAFFASLIAASLPVTGFLIWRGRRKKKKAVKPATVKKELVTVV